MPLTAYGTHTSRGYAFFFAMLLGLRLDVILCAVSFHLKSPTTCVERVFLSCLWSRLPCRNDSTTRVRVLPCSCLVFSASKMLPSAAVHPLFAPFSQYVRVGRTTPTANNLRSDPMNATCRKQLVAAAFGGRLLYYSADRST